jgi:hypothetical protein
VYVSARVFFDANTSVPVSRATLMLHELGHLAGLGHANSSAVMRPDLGPAGPTRYGPGDLTGLRALGRGGCLAVPPAG